MLTVHTPATPAGCQVAVLLAETELPHELRWGRLTRLEDSDGPDGPLALAEPGAMLIYLADKADSPLLPRVGELRYRTLEWLVWQVGWSASLLAYDTLRRGPVPPPHEPTLELLHEQALLQGQRLDDQLGRSEYVAGAVCTIADLAVHGWIPWLLRSLPDFERLRNLMRWADEIALRPAVREGRAALERVRPARIGDQ